MRRAPALVLALCAPILLHGFSKSIHRDLIARAFVNVPAAANYADAAVAQHASDFVDDNENAEHDQPKHSMRPAHISLRTAQERARDYIEYHLSAAVKAFAAPERDKAEAGRHLGRVLHAIADQKHLWCSCSSSGNPEAADSCSSSASGCATPGVGNHAIKDCNWKKAESGLHRNFQILTDCPVEHIPFLCASPRHTPEQYRRFREMLDRAQTETDRMLGEFVRRVENSARP